MKTAILISLAFWASLLAGCTRADLKQIEAVGSPGKVTCYSGGHVIYAGQSTGKISTEQHSDGWYFEDANTGKLIRVSGDCVIEN